MIDPFEEMEDMTTRLPKAFRPAMDVYETKDAVVIESSLAGIKPGDVEVSVEKGVLTIRGASKKEHEIDDKNYYRKEVRSGSFFRQIALPTSVEEDKVNAEFENGVLKITCPKEITNKTKKINIKIKTKARGANA